MKSIRFVLILLAASLFLSACGLKDLQFQTPVTGSGKVVAEERPVGRFERIQMSGFGELVVTQGERETLSVEGEDNLLPYFVTETRAGTLAIHEQTFFTYQSSIPVRFHLTVRELNKIDLSGFAKVTVNDLANRSLEVHMRQFSSLTFNGLKTQSLTGEISGFSRLTAAGEVTHQTIQQDEQSICQVDAIQTR